MKQTATELLRELLDDRGVEHDDAFVKAIIPGCDGYEATCWNDNSCSYVEPIRPKPDLIGSRPVLTVRDCQPEQAIAATLGSGKLTAEQVHDAIFNGSSYASYDGEKYYADGIHMHAIADELNAALRRGTCQCTTPDSAWCFACSECGKSFPRYELHKAYNHGEINYCPNCGRKVVER